MNKIKQNETDKNDPGIGKTDASPPVESLCRPVRNANSARKYLSRLLAAYQRGEIDATNARTSTYVLSEFLRSTDVDSNEQRVSKIEKLISKNLNRRSK